MAAGGPKRCSKCGYDLTGLPGVGACPECNELFNMFTGEGVRAPGVHNEETDRSERIIKASILVGLAVFVVMCSGVIQLLVPKGHALALGCLISILPLLWALTAYMKDNH